jgi:DNA-binding response OmpR family regulator
MSKILIVEDDPVLRETLEYRLVQAGYTVAATQDGESALDLAGHENPDLVLLDIMLPGIDGFEVCRVLRRSTTVPILMLTARTEEVDRVVGLEVGADDYVTKPFSMRELMARIKAQLRRVRIIREDVEETMVEETMVEETMRDHPPVRPAKPLRFDDLVIDLNRAEVTRAGEILALKPKEYELLVSLAQRKGQALSRDNLMRVVWGLGRPGNSRTVDVHIRWLREKIEADPSNPKRIITVRGIGYRFDG